MLLIRWVFMLVGIALMGPLAFVLHQKLTFWYTAQTAAATVVAFEMEKGNGNSRSRYGKPIMYPVVRFITARGDSVQVTSLSGSVPVGYELGEQVEVRYDPANPRQVELPGFTGQWMPMVVTSLFAFLGWRSLRAGLQTKRHNTRLVQK